MGGATKRSMLPSWASLKDPSHNLDSEVYRCCMTELQLQAIVNQQGIETYGVEVSDTLKESVKKYLQQFVGSERVFPTQNDAPRIMTEFLNKPYRFELRDEYTKGPNPRPLSTIKASYYHGKPATQKVLARALLSQYPCGVKL